jgi:hypothetical protein
MRYFVLAVTALCGLPWAPIAYGGLVVMLGTYAWCLNDHMLRQKRGTR